MPALAIIALCIASAVVYGIVHDQFTARVCVEYFTVGHPPIFHTDSPTLLGIGWGIVATWWVGLLLGIPLAVAARAGNRKRRGVQSLVRPIAGLLAVMAVCALLAGIVGFVLATAGLIDLVEPLASGVPRDRHARFIADGAAHLASYAVGFVGGIIVIAQVWRARGQSEERPPREPAANRVFTAGSVLLGVFVLAQAAVLLATGAATLRWSENLAYWLIHRVGEDYALGAVNIDHLEDGGIIVRDPDALLGWMIPVWALGTLQISAAFTLAALWAWRKGSRNGPRTFALVALAALLVLLVVVFPG